VGPRRLPFRDESFKRSLKEIVEENKTWLPSGDHLGLESAILIVSKLNRLSAFH
jgi:hypothetical protein